MKKIKKSKYQYFRYFSLISMILFFVFVAYSNWYANNKISYNQSRLVALAEGDFKGNVYGAFDMLYMLWDNPVDAATSNNGSLWAYTIFGVPISDPVGLISELINSVVMPAKYILGGLIPILLTLLLGRFFCSWLCPMALIFSISRKIRFLLIKIKFPLLKFKLERTTRVVLFYFGILGSYLFGAWVWHFILPYISVSQDIFSYIIFGSVSVGFYFVVALIVLDIAVIPGEFCNSVCPTGFLLSYIGKFSLLKIKADAKNCPDKCVQCKKVCPINLFPKNDNLYSCDLCLLCVDNCPKKHIKIKVRSYAKN